MGFYSLELSQNLTTIKCSKLTCSIQFIADSEDPSQQFRESFKTNTGSTHVGSATFNLRYSLIQSTFKNIRHSQQNAFLQKQLAQQSPTSLYFDFRSLLI